MKESEEKYKAFLSSLYEELREEEIIEAELFEEEQTPVFEKAVAQPDLTITYPRKQLLKRQDETPVYKIYRYVAPALSIAAALLLFILMQSQVPPRSEAAHHATGDEKMQPGFPVLEAPLITGDAKIEIKYQPSSAGRMASRVITITNTAKNKDGMLPARGNEQSIDALENLRRRQFEITLHALENRSSSFILSSAILSPELSALPQDLEQAQTSIFLQQPLQTTSGNHLHLIQKSFSRRSIDNLSRDNMYSPKLSLIRW